MAGKIVGSLKILLLSYAVTAIILVILSFCLYKFNIADWQVTAGIMLTYIVSNLLGGYMAAKLGKSRHLIWGTGFGLIYFGILVLVSVAMNKGLSVDQMSAVRAMAVCVISGAIGGFFVK